MDILVIVLLCVAAFLAGFIDAIVGGGGLIQTPMGIILLPNLPVSTIIGSLKIPSFGGTFFAAIQYLKKIEMNWKLLFVMMILAVPSAYLCSSLLVYMSNNFMKPLLLVILSLLLIYTYVKKNFGMHADKSHSPIKQLLYAVLISIIIGFYDGFIGPGTGSFLVLAFVVILGFDFLHASAYAKVLNCMTNISALIVFIRQGNYLLELAILMAICNITGSLIGTKIALKKGNTFIRTLFLLIVSLMILRFAYDVFIKK
jgi:uncharacterized membrane protein YfcA